MSRISEALAVTPMAEVAAEFIPLHEPVPGHPCLSGTCPACGGVIDVIPWVMRLVKDGSHGQWFCHGCQRGGDAVLFVQVYGDMGLEQALGFLLARAELMDELRLLGPA